MASGQVCSNHHIRSFSAMTLHALHKIRKIFAGAKVTVSSYLLEDIELFGPCFQKSR